jgi:anti-sigma regulatory factor (Ser/Thr protein kinase)
MDNAFSQSFTIQGKDFFNAGGASTEIKSILKQLGIDAAIVRRVAIATYEAEMNVVMYADEASLILEVTPRVIRIVVHDRGPGIPDIELAMREGYSTATPEMREMGFGAGMGLPNIKRNSDELKISSTVGKGTTLDITINVN